MKWKFVEVPLPPVGEGWGEQVYLDDTLRIQVLERLGARVPSELIGEREEDEDAYDEDDEDDDEPQQPPHDIQTIT